MLEALYPVFLDVPMSLYSLYIMRLGPSSARLSLTIVSRKPESLIYINTEMG